MVEFQLIFLSEVDRTAIRKTRHSGALPLIHFRSPAGVGMSSADNSERVIGAEDIASWYTPRDALRYAAAAVGKEGASNAIWQRLIGGMIAAVSTTSSSTPKDGAPIPEMNPRPIPSLYWQDFAHSGSDFWKAGDAKFFLGRRERGPITYRCFGIRLNPTDVHAMLPAPLPEPERRRWRPRENPTDPEKPTETPTQKESEPLPKGPPVSAEHLQAWYRFTAESTRVPLTQRPMQ